MNEIGLKARGASVADLDLEVATARWNLSPAELIEEAILRAEGHLASSGALAVDTGEFTGRSPRDRYIVRDPLTEGQVSWGDVNIPFAPEHFEALYHRVKAWLRGREVFVKDAYACAGEEYRLKIRVVTETAYQSLFVHNLFLRLRGDEMLHHRPDWTVLVATGFKADPERDHTRSANFTILDFSRKLILIGGTGYAGEIKKAVFSVLNFLLPLEKSILPMHCAANVGAKGDVALFFGLSGTGKTTLSADPSRRLVGDDEHGWSGKGIFNFEGGCYAKCIGLSPEHEPGIFGAIRFGALLENTRFKASGREVDFYDGSKTENTRAAYPLDFLKDSLEPSCAAHPRNIFFLTADAFGVLPPIARLSPEQAMYYFISGYTAKVAGTEAGVSVPQATFSACFGKAFLPLRPGTYAALLGERLRMHRCGAWLLNTGWTGGPFGKGRRISLKHTRALVRAALSGQLDKRAYAADPIFGLQVPRSCPDFPAALLDPRSTWEDPAEYDKNARKVAAAFVENFRQYASGVDPEILRSGPPILEFV